MASVVGLEQGKASEITETENMLPVSSNLKIESVSNNGDQSSQSLTTITVDDSKGPEHRITVDNSGEYDSRRVTMESRKFMLGSCPLPQFAQKSERTRVYHFWPGNNVFFIRGRLICGPDPKGFFVTSISIILSTWVFCAFVADDFYNSSGLIVAFCMTLAAIAFVNLTMASSIDPGIIPRNEKWQLDETGARDVLLKRSKRVRILNGVEVKLKLCRICKIIRPPRSSHCAICDNCVEKFDHHCPWIGQCIGLRNYRFYLTFISSALIFFTYIFIFSCQRIFKKLWRNGALKTLGSCPETIALALFSFTAMWFLGGLTCFHLYLIIKNQTAYENHKRCYVDSPNPYNKGALSNIKEVFFVRLQPSRVNFRGEVMPDQGCVSQG